MHETQQDLPAGSWRAVEAMANTGASTYAEQVLWALGRVMAQLPDSLHSQTHKRHAVFELGNESRERARGAIDDLALTAKEQRPGVRSRALLSFPPKCPALGERSDQNPPPQGDKEETPIAAVLRSPSTEALLQVVRRWRESTLRPRWATIT